MTIGTKIGMNSSRMPIQSMKQSSNKTIPIMKRIVTSGEMRRPWMSSPTNFLLPERLPTPIKTAAPIVPRAMMPQARRVWISP